VAHRRPFFCALKTFSLPALTAYNRDKGDFMLQRLKDYFVDRQGKPDSLYKGFQQRHIAVAALMVEAARKDGDYHRDEHEAIARLIKENLKLPPEHAEELLKVSESQQRIAWNDWIFCEQVKRGYTRAERVEIVADLWRLAYSDQALHRFESKLIDNIAMELGVSEAESLAARVVAKSKAGLN
jgi:uncharacterized tellurite resistance protein B-like protein